MPHRSTPPNRPSWVACFAAIALSLALPVLTFGHALDTNLYAKISLNENVLIYEVDVGTFQFPPLADIEFGSGETMPTLEERRQVIEDFVHEKCPVTIDSVVVRPVLASFEFDELEDALHLNQPVEMVYVNFVLHYPIKNRPKKISMKWGFFVEGHPDGDEGVPQPDPLGETHDPRELTADFVAYGEYDIAVFAPDEPEFVWHATNQSRNAEAPASTQLAPTPKRKIALLPIGIAVGLIGFLAATRGKLGIAAKAPIVAVAFVGMFLGRNTLPMEFGTKAPKIPAAEAVDVFRTLHANVYRAFDYETEEAIYDSLAESVDGPFLDTIYNDIYQSLILRDEGGAVCKVQKVDILSSAAAAREDGSFGVACHWRVHGWVRHFQHTHRRINEYKADYTMSPRDQAWKITGAQVTEQKRVNPGDLKKQDAGAINPGP